ncbi:hypothetical protein B0H67DRAFT_684362 [Lasiosphaeris hirsuta]|uniref:Prolyl 4-hydroxylase alpha subunit Fe(2+) 2OG dioxygenase domain-containing protein n=1 Tax=Lasiosphaeris hirsuta TaxID=260670 RepID=A0AA40DX74_9PEZI|nr:hypothetical protein B0H67DRAFT_684362 [Lasiosphaeris hirsuta]
MAAPALPDATNQAKNDLRDALESVKAAGTFAAFTSIDPTNIAPILVRNVGLVEFPLQDSMADRLIEAARQAPYGRGGETFVDTSVRNTLELDAAQLDLGHDVWRKRIDSACKWVARQLGIVAPVTAELYKMLIYDKGAMFKAHTDTEKIPGMFGTLVICLPSEHRGGDLVLKHRGVTKVFKTSETQPCMFCWYSDVSHEVLPVTTGRRWVLTYNLAISNPLHRPSAALNAPRHSEVQKALGAWLQSQSRDDASGVGQPSHLYYLLDHAYTEANISLQKLKGVDLSRMQCLKDVCDGQGVSLLFGVLEKEEIGDCEDTYGSERDYYDDTAEEEDEDEDQDQDQDQDDNPNRKGRNRRDDGGEGWHSFIEVIETNVFIKKLVNAEGRALQTDVAIDMADLEQRLIQDYENPFETAESEETDYTGFTGNEGVSATHWYRMTIAVIVPNEAVDFFLTKGITQKAAQDLLPQYLMRCSDPALAGSAMKMVHHLAQLAWSSEEFTTDSYPNYGRERMIVEEIAMQFFEVVLVRREYELFRKAVGWLKTQLGTRLFTLVKSAAAEESFDFDQVKNSLLQNLSIRSVTQRIELLAALVPFNDNTGDPQTRDWAANEAVPSALEACGEATVTAFDGTAIVTMVRAYRDVEFFKTRLVPMIEKRAASTPFVLAAILQFIRFAEMGIFEQPAGLELCKPLLKSAINAMDIATLRTKEGATAAFTNLKAQKLDYRHVQAFSRDHMRQISQSFEPSALAECFSRCIQFDWDSLSTSLSVKIVAKVNDIPPTEFRHLWIPFIHELISTLNANNVSLSSSRYQEMACAILEAYLDRHVGKEPSGEVNYRQSPVGCHCADCSRLNLFLQSNERIWRFPVGKSRRQHVHRMLDSAGSRCTHITEHLGSPHTLVVDKGIDAVTKAKKEWTDRYAQAWDDIAKFDQEQLRMLLGGEFEKITSMRHLRLPGAQVLGVAGSQQRVGVSMPPTVPGMKRRAEDQSPSL